MLQLTVPFIALGPRNPGHVLRVPHHGLHFCSGLRPSAITLVDRRTSDTTWASLPLA